MSKKYKTDEKKKPRLIQRKLTAESDGVYVLKLVGILILGTLWIKLRTPFTWLGIPVSAVPVGTVFAIIMVRMFENDIFDRKIWYAVLVIIAIISYFVPAGIVI